MKLTWKKVFLSSLLVYLTTQAFTPQTSLAEVLLQVTGELTRDDDVFDDGTHYDVHTFKGQAGQQVNILLESQFFDTYLLVLDPSETIIGENDDIGPNDSNSALLISLTTTGSYIVIVNAYDSSGTGSYSLTVNTIDPDDITEFTSAPACAVTKTPEEQVPNGQNIFLPLDTRDFSSYLNDPANHPAMYPFALAEPATASILNSSQGKTLVADISASCDALSAVTSGLDSSSGDTPLRLLANRVDFWTCIKPSFTSSSDPLPGGKQYCS